MAAPPKWMSPAAAEEIAAAKLPARALRAGAPGEGELDAPGERCYDERHVGARLAASNGQVLTYDDNDDMAACGAVISGVLLRANRAAEARLRAIRRAEALEARFGGTAAGGENKAKQRSREDAFGVRRGRMEVRQDPA